MNKILSFSSRNFKEIIRDPLSYIFCLGFPLVMLVIMSIINDTIPPEAGMTLFRIDNLSGGVAVFGLSFVMLFTTLSVSKDRSGAFLTRLYASPMTSGDFIAGYMLPCLLLAVLQSVITFAASLIVNVIVGGTMSIGGSLLAVLALIPGAVFFISAGLLFGSLFSEKSAPGLCSVIISLASLLGGVWFDCEAAGGIVFDVCKVLPFFHFVKAARMATAMQTDGIGIHLLISLAYAVVFTVLAAVVFRSKMKADLS